MNLKPHINPQELCDFLNDLVRVDPVVVSVITAKYECNEQLANHPTVQCGLSEQESGHTVVGMLGIINGAFGIDARGYGPITMEYDPADLSSTRFRLTEPTIDKVPEDLTQSHFDALVRRAKEIVQWASERDLNTPEYIKYKAEALMARALLQAVGQR